MDARNMSYDSNFFDIIIDKSTIDTLLCGEDGFLSTAMMLKVIILIKNKINIGMLKSSQS